MKLFSIELDELGNNLIVKIGRCPTKFHTKDGY